MHNPNLMLALSLPIYNFYGLNQWEGCAILQIDILMDILMWDNLKSFVIVNNKKKRTIEIPK